MSLTFRQFVDARSRQPVLIPTNIRVVAIRAASDQGDPPDSYWLEYVWYKGFGGESDPEKRSILVQGPLDSILATLEATTTGVDARLLEHNEELQVTNSRLTAEIAELRERLALLPTLDLDSSWLNEVEPSGTPVIYSSVKWALGASWCPKFFVTPLGVREHGFSVPLQLWHTNLREQGRIPNGQPFIVTGVKVELYECTPEVRAWCKQHMAFKWDFYQTMVDIGPLGAFSWSDDGQIGCLKLAQDGATFDGELAGSASADGGQPHQPGNFFRYGRAGVALPGATAFAVRSVVPTDPEFTPAELRGLTVILRVSLHGYYPSAIELG